MMKKTARIPQTNDPEGELEDWRARVGGGVVTVSSYFSYYKYTTKI